MKVFLTTLGCKLNESELESWMRQFAAQGDEIVNDACKADLCVVNTCTVTQAASRKSRGLINKVTRANKRAPVVVTGCYATLAPDAMQPLPNIAFVVSNSDKDQLVARANEFMSGCHSERSGESLVGSNRDSSSQKTFLKMTGDTSPHPRTRAFVKIQDGCNMACTYCIIPLARGRAHSRPQKEIVDEVAHLVDAGYQEVILTGVQISDYRLEERETGRGQLHGLCSLVREILNRTALPRLRLTSIAPWDLDKELLDLFSDARLCRHLHLSLQSGSTSILRRMRRPYRAEQFAEAVDLAREYVPDVGVTTDVIVGFPGESDVEFAESLAFVEQMGFSRVHVFSYSARAGTVASQLPLQVPGHIKDARAKAMQRVADERDKLFAQKFLGRTLPVLYEAETGTLGVWSGYTDNYIHLVARSEENLANRIMQTRIEALHDDGACGHVLM